MPNAHSRRKLVHDLFLPMLMLSALGAMTWAIRGCKGFGTVKGGILAGIGRGIPCLCVAVVARLLIRAAVPHHRRHSSLLPIH